MPEYRAAMAYMTLLKKGEMPPWALFCMQSFKHGADKTYPTDPAARGEGVLLLAPLEIEQKLKGLMIAESHVSGKAVAMHWEGQSMLMQIPEFEGAVFAQSDVELTILRQLGSADALP